MGKNICLRNFAAASELFNWLPTYLGRDQATRSSNLRLFETSTSKRVKEFGPGIW